MRRRVGIERVGQLLAVKNCEIVPRVGEVKNAYGAKPEDRHGVSVSLDASSKWIVDRTSHITSLTHDNGAAVAAREGCSVTMTVDGTKKTIGPGAYKGQIVLTVAKIIGRKRIAQG
ncbi:MAG TPA: hypothetical protein DCE18_00170 [Syntrophobacteraceae bacterium]|jgi:hypothetical protein|nr:hypothetical protein [Syntrophobacteraceae bacterium]